MSADAFEEVMPTLLTEQEIIDAVDYVNRSHADESMAMIVTYSKNMQFIAVNTDVSAREISEQYEGFASYISLGDTDGLLRFIRTDMPFMEPKTSDDPLLQGRSAVAFLASTCIEAARKGGLPAIRSFAITQHYISLANETSNEELAHYLVLPMMLELTKAVREEGEARMHPLSHQSMNYVRSHLSEPLDGESVANALGVSRKTLCTRFKNETGETFAAYVRRVRVERATSARHHRVRHRADRLPHGLLVAEPPADRLQTCHGLHAARVAHSRDQGDIGPVARHAQGGTSGPVTRKRGCGVTNRL